MGWRTRLGIAFAVVLTGPAGAEPLVDARAIVAELAAQRRALVGYAWKAHAEVTLAGSLVETALYEERVLEAAIVRKRLAAPAPADGPRASKRLTRKVEQVREAVLGVVDAYLSADATQLERAFAGARVTPGGPEGTTLVRARDVVRSGDSMKIVVDGVTLEPRRIEVLTSLDGEPLELRAEFADLPDGPISPVRVVVATEIKEDPMVVTTENTDFTKL